MMICHPYLVTQKMARHTPLLQEKRIYALLETNKTRFPATKQENWLVSRLRKGREKMRHSFFESAPFSNPRLVCVDRRFSLNLR